MDRTEVFRELTKRNIVKVVIGFSGGNDEGGADTFTAHLADGTEQEMPGRNAYPERMWLPDQNRHSPEVTWTVSEWDYSQAPPQRTSRPTPEEIADSALLEELERPIDEEYGGFAGDFSVSGVLTWDVTKGTVVMEGEQSAYVPFGHEV